jgi:hypothetical protein
MKKIILLLSLTLTLNVFAQVPSYVPTSGLVGWWPFTGNANDSSGMGNNGTINGATLTSDRYGNANSAYNFSANGDMIGITSTLINPQNFTISLWCKILSSWSYTTFNMLKVGPNDATSLGGFSLRYDQNDMVYGAGNYCIYGAISDNSTFLQTNSPFYGYPFVSNWNNFVFIKNDDTTKLYINNLLVTANTNVPLIIDFSTADLQIGNQQNSNNNLCGIRDIDDIGIWNRALTQQEITDLYTSSTLGISEVSQSNLFSVYPNPANSHINVKADAKLLGSVFTIYDNTGKVVLSGTINAENTSVELGNLSAGIYLFSVGENVKQTFKVIKE